MDVIFDFLYEYVVYPLLLLLVGAIVFLILYAPYYFLMESKRPEFSLKKDDWSCSRVHEYTSTTMVVSGKIMVPQMITHHDCEQWSHK